MDHGEKNKTWWPAPSDKYLPMWVIFTIIFSVLILSWRIIPAAQPVKQAPRDIQKSSNSTAANDSAAAKQPADTAAPTTK